MNGEENSHEDHVNTELKPLRSLEVDGTVFFSILTALLFLWFTIIYYNDVFVLGQPAGVFTLYPVAKYTLVLGGLGLGVAYLVLALGCWKRPFSTKLFFSTTILSSILVVGFFIFRYENAQVYTLPVLSVYIDFLQGDNLFNGVAELLTLFFALRAFRVARSMRGSAPEGREEPIAGREGEVPVQESVPAV